MKRLDDSEWFGAFPAKTELTVLSADNTKNTTIGWVCREYSGSEVYALDLDGNPIQKPLLNENDLYPGRKILAPTLFGFVKAEVIQNENGKFQAVTESGDIFIFLEFYTDDRKCWTSSGAANLRGIKKGNIDTKSG